MLALLRPITVDPGDAILVPAGTPHAIGEDLLILELQEPTDLSILLEWRDFDIDGAKDGHLGLGFNVAIGAIRPDALTDADLERLVVRAASSDTRANNSLRAVMPPDADPYFRAWAIRSPLEALPQGFGVLLVLDGEGQLVHRSGSIQLSRGVACVVPAAAHPCRVAGRVSGYFSQPPSATAPDPGEWDAPTSGGSA